VRKATFFDKSVFPDGAYQHLLFDKPTCILDQEEKGFEQFRCNANTLTTAQEQVLGRV
jgi:hypothetical protein